MGFLAKPAMTNAMIIIIKTYNPLLYVDKNIINNPIKLIIMF